MKKLAWIYKLLLLCCLFADVSLEAFTCPPFVTISGITSEEPYIGIDDAGNATAIWRQFDGVNTNIQTAMQPKGGVWSMPVTISSAIGNNVNAYPQIAVDPAGDAVAIWAEINAGTSTVRGSMLPFGGSWTTPVDISAPTTVPSQVPKLAINSSGYVVAVWIRNNGTHAITQSSSLQFGGSWSAPVDISSASIDTFSPQVGIDAAGNAVAVWLDVTTQTIQTASLPFGGSWTAPINLSATGGSGEPQIAMNPAGYAVATWTRFNGSFFAIQASTLQFGGSWSAPLEISTPGSGALASAVAVDLAGNAIALWSQVVGFDIIVQSSYLPFGSSWSSPPLDVSPTGALSFDVRVAFDAAGNAYAVWDRDNGSDIVIQTSMLPFGGTSWFSPPCQLSVSGENTIFPQIAVDPTGYAVVDWTNLTLNVIQSSALIPPPTVTKVRPHCGPKQGGNRVIIKGDNFINVTAVTFGSTNASFTVISPTRIVAIAPPGHGSVDVTVTTLQGTSPITVDDHYTYCSCCKPKPPAPPKHFKGVIVKKCHRHDSRECLFKAQWEGSPSEGVIFYRIYKNGKVIKQVRATSRYCFKIELCNCCVPQFAIAAVDSSHQESKHVELKIEFDR